MLFRKKKIYKRPIRKKNMGDEKKEKKKKGVSAGKQVKCGKCMNVIQLNDEGHCPSCNENHNA